METETTFFQRGDIVITNARFIVGALTFAMRNITSVQVIKVPPSYNGPGTLFFLSVIIVFIGFFGSLYLLGILGIILFGFAVWLTVVQKSVFLVMLRTAGGELAAYQSSDQNYISQIVEALNQAIIANG